MGKRHRINKGGKGREWKKGHSSDSNPTLHKHRDLAKLGNVNGLEEPKEGEDSRITGPLKSLTLSNSNLETKSIMSKADSELTEFTNCTNPTFAMIHRIWRSGSQMQNDVMAVLAAVTEIINNKGGKQTDPEFFATLLTALAGCPNNNATQVTATAYLLAVVMKRIDRNILRAQFGPAAQVIYCYLGKFVGSSDAHTLKQLVSCFGTLLRAQHASIWNISSNRAMLTSLLTFVVHENAWVRKLSRNSIQSIICDPIPDEEQSVDAGVRLASTVVADYSKEQIQLNGGSGNGKAITMRILKLLELVLHKLPAASFKEISETILRVTTLSDSQVKLAVLLTLQKALLHQPNNATLQPTVNAQLILALYDFQPTTTDIDIFGQWIQTLCEAHVCLQTKDPPSSVDLLPRTVNIIVKCFETGNHQLASAAALGLERLTEYCYKELVRSISEVEYIKLVDDLLTHLQESLGFKSVAVWDLVLSVIGFCFAQFGFVCSKCPSFSTLLNTLAEFRDNEQLEFKTYIDKAIGFAIEHIGAEIVINGLGFKINPDLPNMPLDIPRSWLIPLLRSNIKKAPLAYFIRLILPCAMKLWNRIKNWQSSKESIVLVKVYTMIQQQLWDLLPAFCYHPTDFCASFKDLAQVLGMALVERPDLRLTILNALRSLVKFANEGMEDDREVVKSYAKNYLPILFNLYTADTSQLTTPGYDTKGVRLAVLETVRAYLKLAPEQLVQTFAQKAAEKLISLEVDDKKVAVLDILIAFVPYMESAHVSALMTQHSEWFRKEGALQKKAFRLLEEAVKGAKVKEINEIESVLITEGKVSHQARAPKVSVMSALIDKYTSKADLVHLVDEIFSDLIMYLDTREKQKTRRLTAKTLVQLVAKVSELSEDTSLELGNFFIRLGVMLPVESMAECAQREIRPVLIAASILVKKFGANVNATTAGALVSRCCALLADDRPAVLQINVSLLKAMINSFPQYILDQYMDTLLTGVFAQRSTTSGRNIKTINARLFKFLIKKLGSDFIRKYALGSVFEKQWKHIDKIERRHTRKRQTQDKIVDKEKKLFDTKSTATSKPETIADLLRDSDSEAENGEAMSEDGRSTKSKKSHLSLWLKEENDEDEVIDLLEGRKLAKKVTSTNPSLRTKKDAKPDENRGFKVTADGRLIIGENDNNEVGNDDDSDEDDDDDVIIGRKRKSKLKDESKIKRPKPDIEVDTQSMRIGKTWAPGGKGIHRRIEEKKPSKAGVNFKSNKARGDVQMKGQKFKPYAYVPIKRSKKQKIGNELKHIVQGAKKGVKKGKKGKNRRKMIPI